MLNIGKNKSDCCGCGGCVSICPMFAIKLSEDDNGFKYPVIDEKRCIGCGLCEKICVYGKAIKYQVIDTYIASTKNEKYLNHSSSGGVFPTIAESFIKEGGYVYGAELLIQAGCIKTEHSMIQRCEDIKRLQGSKYVQSDISSLCYKQIEKQLISGKKVLFSGTPCQVAQVKKQFSRYAKNLYTIDIICHGVPNQRVLNDYFRLFEDKGTITDIMFRDKIYGWGLNGKVTIVNKRGDTEEILFSPTTSSYYHYFLNGDIYRENCYSCPYACVDRVGDITVGDYWGVEKYSPECLKEKGGLFDKEKGISCIMVNSKAGRVLLELVNDDLQKEQINLEKVLAKNKQLREPVKNSSVRSKIFSIYRKKGYIGVEKYYRLQCYMNNIKYRIYMIIQFIKR